MSSSAPTTGGAVLMARCNTGRAGSNGGTGINEVRLAERCIDFGLGYTNQAVNCGGVLHAGNLKTLVIAELSIQV